MLLSLLNVERSSHLRVLTLLFEQSLSGALQFLLYLRQFSLGGLKLLLLSGSTGNQTLD